MYDLCGFFMKVCHTGFLKRTKKVLIEKGK